MAGATAASKSKQIADKIEAMSMAIKQGDPFNLFSWKQLERELESIKGQPENYGHYLLNSAALWGIRGDEAEISKFLNIYVGKLGKDWNWHAVRASLTPFLGKADGVAEMLEFGYPKDSRDVLAAVAELCTQSGFFLSSKKILDDLQEYDPEFAENLVVSNFSFVKNAAHYMLENELGEISVAERITHLSKVMVCEGVHLSKYNVIANKFGITFEFAVNAEVERLVDLNMLISDRLAADFSDSLSQHLSVGVVPWEDV
ncbi:hypothetical protein [Pseudomonas sp. B10(2017)]|uniref:hypothetical protein n=1 Tax=Pseudomonas sp. B10(2017) TaxID=1981749 RepID=UPI000A1FC6F0|nr:hypothetical protein [Pseudomonas sp. B10(2017)]